LLGNDAEARTYVDRVRAVKTPNPAHRWLRLAEACSRFGDDAAVLQVGVDAGIERRNPRPEISPFLYHLVAVAALRQGDSKRARRLWQRALDLDPGLDIAAENLDDLEMPAEERNGPWAFYTDTWLGETLTDEMAESVGKLDPDSVDKQARREFERLLGRRPEIRAVLPIFMHMGDRYGCVTAAMMAGVSSLPEVRAALKEFVFGNHGPDDIRFLLADELARQREIPPGITVLWQEGKRTDVLLLGIAIDDSPDPAPLAKSVQSLADQAGLAMQAGRFDEAERKFREALALQPNQALLHYSVGFCALQAGRLAEAETQFRALLERAPNFLLSHVGLASVYLRRHEPEKAAAALAPLHEKTLLRVEEFSFLCQTEVDILLSQGKRDAARLWAEAWGEIVEGAPSFNDLVKSHQKLYGR
jgi:Tfp pilus assembly protein PilF